MPNTYKAGCWTPRYQYDNWRQLPCDLVHIDTATSLEEAKRFAMEMAEESGAIMADVREYIPTQIGGMEGHSFEFYTNKRDSRNHEFHGWTN